MDQTHPTPGSGPRPSRVATALLLTGALTSVAACAGPPGDAASAIRGEELPVPAGEGSQWPSLALGPEGPVLSWLEEVDSLTELRASVLRGVEWSDPWILARGDDFFVNWADFPSVVPLGDSLLLAHWLVRGAEGGYDYGIRVAGSRDGGRNWSQPWIPHGDRSPTEHGFLTFFPTPTGPGMVWLDGRAFVGTEPGEGEMAVRFRTGLPEGPLAEEMVLDHRACDCCQTDAAVTGGGPVVVYRDRGPDETRDISIVRLVDGIWTSPVPVYRDGWVMPACPVNGPAVAARGDTVAVAWFTGADERRRVLAAFSQDAGASFGAPVRVDEGSPFGRVDVVLQEGSAVVSWVERDSEGAQIRLRGVWPDGTVGESWVVAPSTGSRAGGFPRMIRGRGRELLVAWTDPSGPRVRVARMVDVRD